MNPDDVLFLKHRELVRGLIKIAINESLKILEPEEVQSSLCMALCELEIEFDLTPSTQKQIESMQAVALYNVAGDRHEEDEKQD